MGWRTCQRLKVRTVRWVSWKLRQASSHSRSGEFDEFAAHAFLIGDHLLVLKLKHFQRQHLTPVIHEPAIFAIVEAKYFDVGAVAVRRVEAVGIDRHAIVHRVTAAVDDRALGKSSATKPNCMKLCGILSTTRRAVREWR